MSGPDFVNGMFEGGGAILSWFNVRRLLRDRQVQGVYWPITAFWSLWGAWNLYYYPTLDQWASFVGGLGLVIGNSVWVALAIYFTRRAQ